MLSTKKLTGSRSDAGQDAIRNFAADRFLLDVVVPKSFSLDPLELLPLEILLWVWLPSRCILFNNGIFKVISFDTYSFQSLSLRSLDESSQVEWIPVSKQDGNVSIDRVP